LGEAAMASAGPTRSIQAASHARAINCVMGISSRRIDALESYTEVQAHYDSW
jgi:hypothetical protein